MDIPATLDTAKFRQLVLQGIGSLSGGSGAATSTNTAVGPDGVTRVPLQVNADGELKVNVEASINADLTLIENKLDTIIGIETPQAADVSAIKTKLNNSIAVTGTFYQATQPVSLASVPSHAVTNAGTFAVQNTAATPAGTNFIGSVNPDSTGSGSVTTSVPFVVTVTNSGTLAFQSDAAATGTVTIEASVDGTAYTATTYTALATGNTSSSFNAATATIGQIDTSGFKNIRFRSNTIVGTVGITYNLSKNVSNVMLDNPLPAGTNAIGSITNTAFTANAGTNLNTSALALESGGNLATVATKMSDGTQTTKVVNGANTLAVDSLGAATVNNGANQTFTYSTTSSIASGTVLLGPYTCSAYRSLSLHITSSSTGTYRVEVSNDNANWASVAGLLHNASGTAANQFTYLTNTTGYTAGTVLAYPLQGVAFVRVVANAALSGSTNAIAISLSQQAIVTTAISINSGPNPAEVSLKTTPQVTSGFSNYHSNICTASTNYTNVKSTQTQIGTLILTNSSATFAFFHLCNTSAAPTSATVPIATIGVPPNSSLDCSTSYAGYRVSTGLSYSVTGAMGTNAIPDATALLAASTFCVNMTYA